MISLQFKIFIYNLSVKRIIDLLRKDLLLQFSYFGCAEFVNRRHI